MRHWRITAWVKRSLSRWMNYRCAFVYAAELLARVSTSSGSGAAAGSGVLPPLHVGSQSPKLGCQACEPETSGVLGAREHWLSRSGRAGRRRHRVVLDRAARRVRQASQADVTMGQAKRPSRHGAWARWKRLVARKTLAPGWSPGQALTLFHRKRGKTAASWRDCRLSPDVMPLCATTGRGRLETGHYAGCGGEFAGALSRRRIQVAVVVAASRMASWWVLEASGGSWKAWSASGMTWRVWR